MKIIAAIAAAALFAGHARASSVCAGVGNDLNPIKCEHESSFYVCLSRSPESIKARQDCEDGIAARDAALLLLAGRVGASDLAGKTVYGWHFIVSTDDAKHQFDLLDLLIKTLDKTQAQPCKPGECPATME